MYAGKGKEQEKINMADVYTGERGNVNLKHYLYFNIHPMYQQN